MRKISGKVESAFISKSKHIKHRAGFYEISSYLADIILREDDIEIENR